VPPLTPTALPSASARARSTALSIPSLTKVKFSPTRSQPSGTLCVSTTTGLSSGCRPPHPDVKSNSLRPTTNAPVCSVSARTYLAFSSVSRNVSSGFAVGTSTSPLPIHLKRCSKPVSFGPEM